MNVLQKLRQFYAARDGVAAMEFALNMPLLLILAFGGFETSRFLLVNQKTDKIAYIVADVVSQSSSSNLSKAQLDKILIAATQVMQPLPFGASGYVIINSVSKTGTNPAKVTWQYKGGGTMVRTSQVGTTSNNATLPGGITISDKENVIVVEVYYKYAPLFGSGYMPAKEFYRTTVFKPRLGALTTAPS